MTGLADIIDAAADLAGRVAKWFLLAVVALELVNFFSRAVFGLFWPALGETGLVLNAVVVLFGGGTLLWTHSPLVGIPAFARNGKGIIHLAAGALTVLFGLALLATTLVLARSSEEPPAFSDALLVGAIAIFSCWLALSGVQALLRELTPADGTAA